MKKALIYGLSAALLLASLTACNKPQADQQNTEPNPTQAATSTPAPEEPTTTPEPEVTQDPTTQTPAAPEQLSSTTQAPPAENEASQPPEETDPQEPAETDPFSPVEETVYATGTVNIRSGPSTDTEKVGSLSRGQSVTRTGVGTGDYAKWSRVELEDGTEVYIASSYISTTKPTTQSTTNNGGGGTTQTTKPGGSTSGSTTQTQPSSSKTGDGSDLPAGITFNKPSSSTGGYAEDSGAQGGYTQQDLDEIAQGITGG